MENFIKMTNETPGLCVPSVKAVPVVFTFFLNLSLFLIYFLGRASSDSGDSVKLSASLQPGRSDRTLLH